jgi:anti-sigma B factor antagonist
MSQQDPPGRQKRANEVSMSASTAIRTDGTDRFHPAAGIDLVAPVAAARLELVRLRRLGRSRWPGSGAVDVMPDRERVLVRPLGDVDIATAEQLERPVVELIERGFSRVVLDLRGVTFLDSSGVHALVQCRERAEERGARMSIILGGAATRRVLDITGLIDHFEIEPAVDGHRPPRAVR